MISVLLIDDEPSARETLRILLADHPQYRVVGEAGDTRAAQARLASTDYDLVCLDLQLIGGNGFDLVPFVRPEARIIFVTAFDQYALRAFEVNALDYLLKPVTRARLAEALRRVEVETAEPQLQPPSPRPLTHEDVTFLKTGQGSGRFVALRDIVAIKAADNYTEVHLSTGESALVRRTLAGWEQLLPASHFLRVHRHAIVGLAHVAGFSHLDGDITLLRITGQSDPLRARRENWPELSSRLTALHGHRFSLK